MLTRYMQRHLTWIDLISPTPAEVRELLREFGLDPKVAQELLAPTPKSKVERSDDSLYVVLHFPAPRGAGRAEQEIDFVVGKHFLITARYGGADPLHTFARAFEVNAVLERDAGMTHGGHLFVSMARNLYQALLAECDMLERRLQDIEEQIFKGAERDMVVQISQAGRTIHDFRQALAPHKEMLASLGLPAERLFGHEFSYHLRAVAGEYERLERTLENLRDSLAELRETNNSLLSTKQSEVMKTLTVLAFMFLPLSFLASLFGMSNIPFAATPPGFWIAFGFMLVVLCSSFLYFKKKKWL